MLEAKAMAIMDLTDEIMKDCMADLMSLDALFSIDDEEFKRYKKIMNLMELTKEYAISQAIAMDEINNKLDLLLKK